MSEMSREDAIKELTVMTSLYGMTPRQRRALLITINCTKKLRKIESLYGIDKFGKVITREERDREVQKILRGE